MRRLEIIVLSGVLSVCNAALGAGVGEGEGVGVGKGEGVGVGKGVGVGEGRRADVQYVAHQGEETLAPNHTLAAYRFAAEHGLDYLKLDIRETKDGVIVLQHDDNLRAVYATNIVIREETYANIKQYCRPRSNGKSQFTNETICTLDEALEVGKKMRQGVWIDFKSFSPDLAERTLAKVKDAGLYPTRMMVATWSRKALDYMGKAHPEVRLVAHTFLKKNEATGIYTSNLFKKENCTNRVEAIAAIIEAAKKRKLFGLNVPCDKDGVMTATEIKTLKAAGLWISVWFVNNPADGNYYRAAGADAFVTMCAANTGRPGGPYGYPFAMPVLGIIGHQGDYKNEPNDTVRGLRAAVRRGAHGVEFDVQRCATGEFIVMHDGDLATTTTITGNTWQSSFEHIRSGRIRYKQKVFENELVPTFDEAIDCLPMEGFWINVHCYGSAHIARDIALKLRDKGRLHQAYISATLPLLKEAKKAVPQLKTCNMTRPKGVDNHKPWTDAQNEEYLQSTIANKCDFIQLRQPWPRAFSDRAHAAGIKVNLCSCDAACNAPKNLAKMMLALGIDFIMTENLSAQLDQYWGLQKKRAFDGWPLSTP